MDDKYKIGELAKKTGVTRRTIHYYISKGLIPPAEGAGVNSHYNEDHLVRIELIKMLQQRKYLPLDKIKEDVSRLSFAEVKEQIENFQVQYHHNAIKKYALFNEETPGPAQKAKLTGFSRYIKLEPGLGIEVSVPEQVYQDRPQLAKSIDAYIRKLIKQEE